VNQTLPRLAGTAIVILMFWLLYRSDLWLTPRPVNAPANAALLRIYQDVPRFAEATPNYAAKLIDKGGPIGYIQSFSSPREPKLVTAHFEIEMPRSGWRLDNKATSAFARRTTLKFCKGRVSTSIQIGATRDGGSRYSVSTFWAPDRQSQGAYCSDAE
jgi:hypothetical protein